MATNIKLISGQQQNFTVDQGYFYAFDYSLDNLLVKTDDGNTAFSYPFDTVIGATDVTSAEFDGVYFWSLENPAGSVVIKRWLIENYVCKLQQTYSYVDVGGTHDYDSDAFSVAHYHDTFEQNTAAGSADLLLTTHGDDSTLLGFTTTSGAGLTIHLGPNSSAEEEDVVVTATISGGVTISGALGIPVTSYAYDAGDPIHFYTNIWMFNQADGVDTSTGALYKFDAYTGDLVTKYPSGAYKDIQAATFYRVDSFTAYGIVDTLAYIKGTNILFVDVSDANLPYYGSMVLENIQSDESTVIAVVDLTMDDQNVYRLQKREDGGSGDWSQYNYELSSLDSFVTSISLAAYPAIIAANTVSTSTITAIVKDQFLQPIGSRLVAFTASDPGGGTDGYIVTSPVSTDSDGEASTTFRSGDTASEVTITAVVEQT
jgi:hypothetical protein